MADILRGSAYRVSACSCIRIGSRRSAPALVSGIVSAAPLQVLIKHKNILPFVCRSSAHRSQSGKMLRRKSASVVAKVSQAESKSDSKQEGQPGPDDNAYVLVHSCSK